MKKQINSEIITLLYKFFLPVILISVVVNSLFSGGNYSFSARWLEYTVLLTIVLYYFVLLRSIVNKAYLLKDKLLFIKGKQKYEVLFNQVVSVKNYGGLVILKTVKNFDSPEKIVFFSKLHQMYSIGTVIEEIIENR